MAKIPFLNPQTSPLTSTTQKHLPIAAIEDDLVIHKNGGVAIVMESTSLNFGLLSDREQEAVIGSYAALINSLSFHIQIVVRSQKKDITNYIRFVDEKMNDVQNEKIRNLMAHYRDFIKETIKTRKVLGKRFLIVIPFTPVELGTRSSIKSVAKQSTTLPFTKSYIVKKARTALYPKRDHLIRQSARLGLRLRQLEHEELIALYYEIYNPNVETVKETKTNPLLQ